MNDWLDGLADELGEERLQGKDAGALLSLAREVAHGVERKLAPLSTFVVGMAVGRAVAGGEPRDRALSEAVRKARAQIPESPDQE